MAGIDGKVIAITGASSGIGREAALLLAGRGATVVLGARRIDELEAVVREIESAGGALAKGRLPRDSPHNRCRVRERRRRSCQTGTPDSTHCAGAVTSRPNVSLNCGCSVEQGVNAACAEMS
jgi:NAD(P)-dependent dehydrogenase (short-subunit alcohol dehydrogenase family)